MYAKNEVSISYGSKVIVKVKVDNRQTNKQTDRQDKNNMLPIIQPGGMKIRILTKSVSAHMHGSRGGGGGDRGSGPPMRFVRCGGLVWRFDG